MFHGIFAEGKIFITSCETLEQMQEVEKVLAELPGSTFIDVFSKADYPILRDFSAPMYVMPLISDSEILESLNVAIVDDLEAALILNERMASGERLNVIGNKNRTISQLLTDEGLNWDRRTEEEKKASAENIENIIEDMKNVGVAMSDEDLRIIAIQIDSGIGQYPQEYLIKKAEQATDDGDDHSSNVSIMGMSIEKIGEMLSGSAVAQITGASSFENKFSDDDLPPSEPNAKLKVKYQNAYGDTKEFEEEVVWWGREIIIDDDFITNVIDSGEVKFSEEFHDNNRLSIKVVMNDDEDHASNVIFDLILRSFISESNRCEYLNHKAMMEEMEKQDELDDNIDDSTEDEPDLQ